MIDFTAVVVSTVTELMFAADTIPDGRYLLELQVAPFAAPSRPVLYPVA